MIKKIISGAVILFTLVTVAYSQTAFSEKKIGHVYYVSVPEYMTRCAGLNDVATIQYQSISKDVYFYIIEDSKEEMKSVSMIYANAREFYDDFIKDYAIDTKDRKVGEPRSFKNKNISFIQIEIEYTSEDLPIYMVVTIAEGKDYFYKIMSWTSKDNKEKVKEDMKKTGESLREE